MNAELQRRNPIQTPQIVGAEWWNDALERVATAQQVPRRTALKTGLIIGSAGVVVAALALCGIIVAASSDDGPEFEQVAKPALSVQQEYGWSFGAPAEPLTFNGESTAAFDKTALTRLPTDLAPRNPAWKPFYAATLFQSPTALPRTTVQGDSPSVPLSDALKPIFTTEMDVAYRRGRALLSLFEGGAGATALVVDLPGPESVALAAGLATRFDPVFLFDNWPHPRGVVPAHLTLGAAAYYQPTFVKLQASRTDAAPAAFILDRARLAQYTDEATQFDNRWWAKLPSAAQLKAAGVTQVLYVVPGASDAVELDDLNEDFVAYAAAGISVKTVAGSDFRKDDTVPEKEREALVASGDWPAYYYGGNHDVHHTFWSSYRWSDGTAGSSTAAKPARNQAAKPATTTATAENVSNGAAYAPVTRTTPFTGSGSSKAATSGSTFGHTALAVAVGTGVVLGSRWGSRSGSFNRSGGGAFG